MKTEDGFHYKADYRGGVQDRNVTILPQPMFVLTDYEREEEVKRQVNYSNRSTILNSRHVLPRRLGWMNNETPLTEKQVKQHFESIDNETAVILNESEEPLYHYITPEL